MIETTSSKILRLIREGDYKSARQVADKNNYFLKIKFSGIELRPLSRGAA